MKQDERAIEGIPYQLLIISAVIGLTLPVVYSTWEYYDTRSTIQKVRDEVNFIGQKSEQLFIRGEGNRDTIDIDIDGGLFTDIIYVKFGNVEVGDHTTPYHWVVWQVGRNHEDFFIMPRNIPLVPYEGEDRMDEMILSNGKHELRLTCVFGDLDGDQSRYIKVEKI